MAVVCGDGVTGTLGGRVARLLPVSFIESSGQA